MFRIILIIFAVFLMAAVPDRARQGNQAYEEGRYAEAEQAFRDAIAENPGDARLHFNLGNALARQGKFEDAEQVYERFKSLTNDPAEQALADYNLGNMSALQQQWDEAAERYKRSLRNNPGDEDAIHNLEYARRQLDQEPPPPQQQDQQQDDQGGQGQQPPPPAGDPSDDEQDGDQESGADQQEGDDPQDGQPDQDDSGQEQRSDGMPPPRPGDMTPEEAKQLLDAMVSREQDLIRDFLKDLAEPGEPSEKDW